MTLKDVGGGSKSAPQTSDSARGGPSPAPPAYDEHPPQGQGQGMPDDLSARLSKLTIAPVDLITAARKIIVTPDQCIAHLKFLAALAQLREDVGNMEDLFGIVSPDGPPPSKTLEKAAQDPEEVRGPIRVREKRWAVFVARAVDRFEKWWDNCVPATFEGAPNDKLTCKMLCEQPGLENAPKRARPIVQLGSKDHLPPLDVLMVWHSYMLNPRNFLEDCFRSGKMDFYATPFPWQAISDCLDCVTFEFKPTLAAIGNFENATHRNWTNLDEPEHKTLICPKCGKNVSVPWTNGSQWSETLKDMTEGFGYADNNFQAACEYCKVRLSHDYLRVQKFRNDVLLLLRNDLPLPGTVLNKHGQPDAKKSWAKSPESLFANTIIQDGLDKVLLPFIDPGRSDATMNEVKRCFEEAIAARASGRPRSGRILPNERVSIRKCMSRYWYNSSPSALDLQGACIRQGSFVEKMNNIDWLHSPALLSTMERLIVKYQRFFDIMWGHRRNVAVPTLDVDLAWHTHQLHPQAYYLYCDERTSSLIDHDDKIEETKLSDSFTWTSKIYQEKYGEPYSECTCWYCEAVRETHTSRMDKFFKPNKAKALDSLHAAGDDAADPLKSPHISAHNAVRDSSATAQARARVKAAELERGYRKACQRARKEKRREPRRDDYYSSAWGYPVAYPVYYPFFVPIGIGTGYPGMCGAGISVDTGAGAYGNCAAGTCGGMAAFGGASCANVGGNCGAAGGCGGGSGGCGGGGGGCGGGGCGGGGS